MASKKPDRKNKTAQSTASRGLIPSDQLLAIFAVNIILLGWAGLSFSLFYKTHPPNLPNWIYWGVGFILVASFLLAFLEDLWPRLKKIASGGDAPLDSSFVVNIDLLKAAVFVLTVLDIVVLWQLAEATGGVMSAYAPFLPAPAIFASFVTKKWQTILGLSAAVIIAIGFSSLAVPSPLPDLQAYQGSAVVMVVLAGVLSGLQARVASTGESLTGPAPTPAEAGTMPVPSADKGEQPSGSVGWPGPDLDDDDLASSPEG